MAPTQEKKNIRGGILLTYLRLIVSIVISLFYPPYLLSLIGEVNNGLYQFALSVVSFLLLCSFGIENAYVRYATYSEKKSEDELSKNNGVFLLLFALIAFVELVVGTVVALCYRYGSFATAGSTSDQQVLLGALLSIAVVASSLDFFLSLFDWYVYFRGRFIYEQIIYLALHILTTLGSFLALYFGGDIIMVSLMSLGVQLGMDLITLFYAIFALKMRFSFPSKDEWKKSVASIFSFSLFIFASIVVSQINANLGKIVLGHLVDMSSVTLFGFGIMFYQYESVMANAISNTYSPKINLLAAQGDQEGISQVFLKSSFLQLIVLFGIVGGFLSCGRDFVGAWLSSDHLSEASLNEVFEVSAALLVLGIIPFSETTGIEIQRAENKHRFLALFNLGLALVGILASVLAVLYLPQDLKIYGPVIGIGIPLVFGMSLAANLYYGKTLHLPIRSYWLDFFKVGVPALVGFVVVFTFYRYLISLPTEWNLWLIALIKGASFLVIYLPLLYVFSHKKIRAFFAKKEESQA